MHFSQFHFQNNNKKYVAYPQVDFLFTIDTTLWKLLKKCVFEQFFQIPEILKFEKKIHTLLTLSKLVKWKKSFIRACKNIFIWKIVNSNCDLWSGAEWLTKSWWDFLFKGPSRIRITKFLIFVKYNAQIWGMLTKKKGHHGGGGPIDLEVPKLKGPMGRNLPPYMVSPLLPTVIFFYVYGWIGIKSPTY
jgi:hypothetical protein